MESFPSRALCGRPRTREPHSGARQREGPPVTSCVLFSEPFPASLRQSPLQLRGEGARRPQVQQGRRHRPEAPGGRAPVPRGAAGRPRLPARQPRAVPAAPATRPAPGQGPVRLRDEGPGPGPGLPGLQQGKVAPERPSRHHRRPRRASAVRRERATSPEVLSLELAHGLHLAAPGVTAAPGAGPSCLSPCLRGDSPGRRPWRGSPGKLHTSPQVPGWVVGPRNQHVTILSSGAPTGCGQGLSGPISPRGTLVCVKRSGVHGGVILGEREALGLSHIRGHRCHP